MVDQIKIADTLRKLRQEKGLSQEELAEKLYITNRTVSRWETAKIMPSIDTLMSLSDFYGIELGELLEGNIERKNVMDTEKRKEIEQVIEYNEQYTEESRKELIKWVCKLINMANLTSFVSFMFIAITLVLNYAYRNQLLQNSGEKGILPVLIDVLTVVFLFMTLVDVCIRGYIKPYLFEKLGFKNIAFEKKASEMSSDKLGEQKTEGVQHRNRIKHLLSNCAFAIYWVLGFSGLTGLIMEHEDLVYKACGFIGILLSWIVLRLYSKGFLSREIK